ncbi:sugar-binding protein [Brachybacterium hainanense]|uniref:Sugar-binding protein n=1 Tax=Brachybacterium hainanense TaxID=1541174 RepID=A0ABV6RET4_9MICO
MSASHPTRRSVLRAGGLLGLAAGAATLDLGLLTPAERALADGGTDLDVLYIGAHPDDEAWTLAAIGQWNEFHGQQAGVITITRGEGGGNAVGLEEGPPLGLIREAEERRAVGYAGISHVFNLDAVDFFYTLSAPLSREVWGGRDVLGRIVRVIRATRPDVIITMNPSAIEGNHGNHQQAAMYAVEAYLLAGDRDAFPEHLEEGLEPWAPRRLLRSGSNGTGPVGPDAVATGYTPAVASDLVYGTWNGTLSETHGERWSTLRDASIWSYRTQGWSVIPPTTTDPAKIPATWFTLIASRSPLVEPTSGDEAVLRGASLPIEDGLALGTLLEVRASRFAVQPGVPLEVEVSLSSPQRATPQASVQIEAPAGWRAEGPVDFPTIPAGQSRTVTVRVTPAADAAPGTAVLLRAVVTTKNRGSGWNVVPLRVVGPVEAGLENREEVRDFLEWTQELGMQHLDALVPTRRALASGGSQELTLLVTNHAEDVQSAEIQVQVPEGFTARPGTVQVTGLAPGEVRQVPLTVANPDSSLPVANRGPDGGVYPVTVTASAGGLTTSTAQGICLVPRLVASRTEGVDVDGSRAPGEYPGDGVDIGHLWEGSPVTAEDASGRTWVTYDDEALCVHVAVVDDVFGTVLGADDDKQRFRTDSVEIMIDPRGGSQHTASTFILGVLPAVVHPDGSQTVGGGRDHDNWQGPLAQTAPGTVIASRVSDPYNGYEVEARIPFADLPDGIRPDRVGFNVVVYDSDTQDRTGQSRIGWSTYPGIQADPYRWGVLELPDLPEGAPAPREATIPRTAARSTASAQSIIQASGDGVGLGGRPRLPERALALSRAEHADGAVTATATTDRPGTIRALLWDGEAIIAAVVLEDAAAGTHRLRVDAGGASGELVLAVSLETEAGSAAASAEV